MCDCAKCIQPEYEVILGPPIENSLCAGLLMSKARLGVKKETCLKKD